MSLRRSTRVRQPPARLRDPLVSQDEADLRNDGTPRRVRGRRRERGDVPASRNHLPNREFFPVGFAPGPSELVTTGHDW